MCSSEGKFTECFERGVLLVYYQIGREDNLKFQDDYFNRIVGHLMSYTIRTDLNLEYG